MTGGLTAPFWTGNEPGAVGGLGNRKRRGFCVSCGREIRWLSGGGLEKVDLKLRLKLCGPREIRNWPLRARRGRRKRDRGQF